jgi:hypothetical protein
VSGNTVVGTANRYCLSGSGFENRWKQEIFSSPFPLQTDPRAQTALCPMGIVEITQE